MKKFYELAEHRVTNRNRLIAEEHIDKLIAEKGKTSPLYQSVYWYNEDVLDYLKKNKSMSSYYGYRGIDWIPIDIDKKSNSDEYTLTKLREYITSLAKLNVGEDAYQIFFSGTGYHIFIANSVFDFDPGNDLPKLVALTLKNIDLVSDPAIIRGNQLIRMVNTLNEKSNLFKIPLTLDEVVTLEAKDILKLAETQRLDFDFEEKYGTGQLSKYLVTKDQLEPAAIVLNKDAQFDSFYAACVQTLYKKGPEEGCRNQVVLRIASHFKRQGIPEDATIFAMLGWNQKTPQSLDEKSIIAAVSRTYREAYCYSCKDPILASMCNSRCRFYKYKDVDKATVMNVDDLDRAFNERLEMMANKDQFINLKDVFGLDDDCVLYPGELVVFQGDTGTNKTSIIQNIMLGVDMVNDVVRPPGMSILYYGPELHPGILQLRNYCIATGHVEDEIEQYRDDLHKFKDALRHITVQQGALTLRGIENMIIKYRPAVLIIDYYEQVEHPSWDRSPSIAIAEISKSLSAMAVKYSIIIIAISQINRDGAKNGISIHSGFGSGSIEKTARRLFIIDGEASSPYRTISQAKANSDSLWSGVVIERQDNWRFKRIK